MILTGAFSRNQLLGFIQSLFAPHHPHARMQPPTSRSFLLLILACVTCLFCLVDSTRSPVSDLLNGRILGSHTRDSIQRRIERLTPEQRTQLREESRLSQKEYAAKDHRSSLRSNGLESGPDFSGADVWLEAFMSCRGLAGLGVGVIQGGELVYSNGLGIQDAAGTPVNTDTIFGIGSCTKAFTSTLGALLEEEGLFDFNALVTKYLPDYELADPAITQYLTTTDLLTHRTGLAKNDVAAFLDQVPTRKDRVYLAKYIQSTTSLRNRFMYNNWMVATGGYVLGEIAQVGPDGSWEDLVQEKIFSPLSMKRTFANFSQSVSQTNRATPMQLNINGDWEDEPYEMNECTDIIAPAGAIASTVNDLTQWVAAHLGHNPDFISNASLNFLHSPKMTLGEDDTMPSWLFQRTTGANYAMNWWVGRYNDQKYIWHDGDVWGFHAMIAMLPESDIGVVLLSNSDSADSQPNQFWYREIMAMYLFDIALQVTNPTFSSVQEACTFPCNILPSLCSDLTSTATIDQPAMLEEELSPIVASDSCVTLSDYVGTYFQPAWGNVEIAFTDATNTEIQMFVGNFPYFQGMDNATLTFQSNGGSDRFIWNLINTESQSLYNSQVYFIRNWTDGTINALYLQTTDSSDATYQLWFDRVPSTVSSDDADYESRLERPYRGPLLGIQTDHAQRTIKSPQPAASKQSHLIQEPIASVVADHSAATAPAAPNIIDGPSLPMSPTSFLILLTASVFVAVTLGVGLVACIFYHKSKQNFAPKVLFG